MIQVQLVGGIGNQLFQYYLGKYLSIYKNSKLAFVQPPPNKSHDLSSIEDFFTQETYLRKTSSPNYKDRILRKTINWFPKLESNFLPYLHNFESKKVGMDSSVLKLSSKVNIHGYFQTYYFYEKCIELGLAKPNVLEPSPWLREMSQLFESVQPAAVHCRFGDYRSHKSTIGNLDQEYYLEAIEKLMTFRSYSNIYCFSDDIQSAMRILGKSRYSRIIQFIQPPTTSKASESMLLLSKAKGHVIANSTFSWWGATLSGQENVIAPSVWFRGLQDPDLLIHPNWHLQNSRWVN